MDIKKLGLASTVAVLSVTVALGGCDLFKSESQLKTEKIARLRSTWKEKLRKSDEADFKRDEAKRKYYELRDQLEKEYGSYSKYQDNEEFTKRIDAFRDAKEEADNAFGEFCKAVDKLSPYRPQHEFDTRNY